MKAINKHGLRINGLKKASGLTMEYGAYYWHFVEIFYNMRTGNVWGVYQYSIGHNSWTVYDDPEIVKICNTYHHMTMQEIADAVYDRMRYLNRYGYDGVKIVYDKIKSDTIEDFRCLYPHGTLEDVTGQVIRYLAASDAVRSIGGMSIYDSILIADEIDRELEEIALEEMMREADEE